MSGFDYIAMDEKLKPVAKLMLANRFQLAIDRLQQLVADGIFLPEEMWRVDHDAGHLPLRADGIR